jgi:multiple antibiotic resistance protein
MLEELVNWQEYVTVFVGLLAMVPPPLVIPLFLGVMAGRTASEKSAAALTGAMGFFILMTAFVFLGSSILEIFGISIPAFRLAGGLLLLLIAIDMMRSDPSASDETTKGEGPDDKPASALGIVPITIPILAGPGAISTVVLFATEYEGAGHKILVAIVVLALSVLIYAALRAAVLLDRFITPNAQLVFSKVMGLLICAIAFEFLAHGIAGKFVQIDLISY